ncbi:MAG: gamma-glutamyl-gamma-aminobutyrate hydrolase family protein [Polyangiaceae bacterium]
MARLLVFQHVAYEILGTFDPLLRDAGFRIRYVNFGRHPEAEPSLDGYDGLVVLGGPMNVGQAGTFRHLTTEMRCIERALRNDVPVLGICLGAQLLASTLGARVRANDVREIGWTPVTTTDAGTRDPLLRSFEGTESIFQWHGDTFDVPDGAVHLASSPTCANQAFSYGDRAYGLQFHLEVDGPTIERWLGVPALQEELATLRGITDAETIRRETPGRIVRLETLARKTFGAFIDLLPVKRKRILPSR